MKSKPTEVLTDLGLSAIEAMAYECLLRDGPATGYRVAQTIGRAVANTYTALSALQAKGAVIADSGGSKLVRAVPPEEFLGRLEREFQARRAGAAKLLSGLRPDRTDLRVYRIESSEQVFARAHAMLDRVEYCAVIDAFPEVVAKLREPILRAAARHPVAVKTYQPMDLPGVRVLYGHERECEALRDWPGCHLDLVIDARESLTALLDRRDFEVRQSIWTSCPYISSMHHARIVFEFVGTLVWTTGSEQGRADSDKAWDTLSEFRTGRTPGYADFLRMVRGPSEISPAKPTKKQPLRRAKRVG